MIAILDLNMGNLNSIYNAIYESGFDPEIVTKDDDLSEVSHLVFPGVGHFNAASKNIYDSTIDKTLKGYAASGRPLMGICLGMQLFMETGTEGGLSNGLGLIEGTVNKIESRKGVRVPHVGWNNADIIIEHPVLDGIKKDRDFYFTHSYAVSCSNKKDVVATTEYGEVFPCIIAKKNFIGFQFHPEKSQINGLKIIENFCRWDGAC